MLDKLDHSKYISDKSTLISLTLLFSLSILIRVLNLESIPITGDEAISATEVNKYVIWSPNLSLLLVKPFFIIFGESTLIGRLLFVLISSCMILALFGLRKYLTNEGVIWGGILFALVPNLIIFQKLWVISTIFPFLIVLFITMLSRYLENRSNKNSIYLGLSSAILITIYPFSVVFFAIFLLFLSLTIIIRSIYEENFIGVSFLITEVKKYPLHYFSFFLLPILALILIIGPNLFIKIYPESGFPPFLSWFSRNASTNSSSFFDYLNFWVSTKHGIFLLFLGSFAVIIEIFVNNNSSNKKSSWIRLLILFWFLMFSGILSIWSYKYQRLSQFFIIPLILICSNIPRFLTQLLYKKGVKNYLNKSFISKSLLTIFFLLNFFILIFSDVPGITGNIVDDHKKNASDFSIDLINNNDLHRVVQIGNYKYPWKWHFRNILSNYEFHYANLIEMQKINLSNCVILISEINEINFEEIFNYFNNTLEFTYVKFPSPYNNNNDIYIFVE